MLVTTSLMLGGAETQVFLLATRLARRGHPVHVVSMVPPVAYEAELADAGVACSSLGMRPSRPDPRALWRFGQIVRAWRPDVVHSHMVHANLFARLARLVAPVPVQVSTAHNLSEGARWSEWAYRATDPWCDLSTNVCGAAVDRYVRVGAAPAAKIVRMPNGLDAGGFGPDAEVRRRVRRELGIGDDVFVWLAVGRLEPQKDYPTLLAALSRLDVPAPPALTLVVGSGHLAEEIAAQARAAGLADDRLRLLGPRSDVPDLMRAVDAYVMSSAWEGLPMVLLEAAASRLPIVATDVGGNDEIVLHERSGLLVPAGDPGALADAMAATIAAGPARRLAWGDAGAAHVRDEFDLDRVVDRWTAIYDDLLRRKGRGERAPT
jgi:glycosyltransferase involved in cell wall biosynthesis